MKRSRPLSLVTAVTDGESFEALRYLTDKKQQVVLGSQVLETIVRHRQLRDGLPEAGGMLFAQISVSEVSIVEATEPQISDRRSRFSFWPCTLAQQRSINTKFKAGLHFVGEWHTHPEPRPHPSGLDFDSMEQCFLKSRHELKALVMVILGTDPIPNGLWVSLHNGRGCQPLRRNTRE
jgi:integrative and conjugative element protein (TIGR02256 family)